MSLPLYIGLVAFVGGMSGLASSRLFGHSPVRDLICAASGAFMSLPIAFAVLWVAL